MPNMYNLNTVTTRLDNIYLINYMWKNSFVHHDIVILIQIKMQNLAQI